MDITEIAKGMKEDLAKMTQKEKFEFLRDAKIIDDEGYYHPDFFSEETVKADREAKTPFRKE